MSGSRCPPETIPLDGSFDLQVCADSVAEFLFRFWVENELYFTQGITGVACRGEGVRG